MTLTELNEIFGRCQQFLYERVVADEFLANVPVITQFKGDIPSDITEGNALLQRRNGKFGACIVVQEPIGSIAQSEVPGALMDGEFSFLVLGDPVTNMAVASGTLIQPITIARHLVRMFHMFRIPNQIYLVGMQPQTIVPRADVDAPQAFEVRFTGAEEAWASNAKVATPSISPASGAAPQSVTLACDTDGAEIWYTLDGTYPRSGGDTSVLYDGTPINIAAAATLLAGARLSGHIDSDINAAEYT